MGSAGAVRRGHVVLSGLCVLVLCVPTACSGDGRTFAGGGASSGAAGSANAAGETNTAAGTAGTAGGTGGGSPGAGSSSGGTAGASGGSTETGGSGPEPGKVCEPSQPLCDGNLATTCNESGTGYDPDGDECSASQACVGGQCEALECEPGAAFCEGSSVRRCADDGLSSEEEQACPGGQYCDATSAECKTGVCSPGQPACDGNRATTCNANGSGFAAGGQTCANNETCSAGGCQAQICKPSSTFCQGQEVKSCSATGLSSAVTATCTNQACVATGDSAACAGTCTPGTKRCSGNGVQTCSATGTWGAAAACPTGTPRCEASACVAPKSCTGLPVACGPEGNESCCSSPVVPGGTFNRSNDATYPATVSAFRLDRFEITVGRFRKFVAAYSQNMIPAGAGKNPNNAADPGWSTDWNASLPADGAALRASFKCTSRQNADYDTWTEAAGGNEVRPMNCLTWYTAAAFCAWDGGRLPTEAEWNYAAAGGSEQRNYPWGSTMPGSNAAIAVYGCYFGVSPGPECIGVPSIAPVGAVAAGDGKWGQADLAGNLWEWIADWYASPYPQVSCNNCINLAETVHRVIRSAGYSASVEELRTSERARLVPTIASTADGARCARAL